MSEKSKARSKAYFDRLEQIKASREYSETTHEKYRDTPYGRGYRDGRNSMAYEYMELEDQVARLTALTRGYVQRMASEPPDMLHGEPRRGRRWGKIRHRVPYVENPDGTWKRAKGQLRLADYAQTVPPKVCENCRHLFVAKRADAKTCSPRCRLALHRKARRGSHPAAPITRRPGEP